MQASEIAAAYDQIADRWRDGAFNPNDGMHQHRHALAFLPQGDGGWALNVGCGCSTRHNALFRDHGLQVEGVDVSARMVAFARAADPSVIVHHADICTWQAPRTYRLVSAWDSIWHVRLAQQRDLMIKLLRLLEPGGVLVCSAGGLDAPSEHTDATMGPTVGYATLGIPGLLAVIAEAGCALRHFEFDQLPHLHLVVVAQRAG